MNFDHVECGEHNTVKEVGDNVTLCVYQLLSIEY